MKVSALFTANSPVDEFDELQAWSGVREGVQVSQQSFSHAQAAATQAAQHTASGLKDHLTKGKKILQDTISIASRPKTEAQRPNLKLGGALGIQLSGALMPRIPTPDEDVDPLLQVAFPISFIQMKWS